MLHRHFPRSFGSPPGFANKNMVAVGDSITRGFGATAGYPSLVATHYSSTQVSKTHDGSGFLVDGGTGTLTANASEVDAVLGSPVQTLIIFGGSADFRGGYTATQVYNALTSYFSARITAGYTASQTIVVCALPRTGLVETDRSSFNSQIVSGASTYHYVVARTDLDPNIGVSGAYTNTTYYQGDQTHPTDAGQAILATIIEGVMG